MAMVDEHEMRSPSGAPGEIRTPDPLVRSQMLYPAELRARAAILPKNLQAARRIAPFGSHGSERNCEGGNAIGAIAFGLCWSHEYKVSHFVDSSPCRSVRSKRSEKMMNPNGRKTSIGAERLHSATALLSRTRDQIQISDTSRKQSRELHRQMRHSS